VSVWRWADVIAPVPVEARVTLGEGLTPLVPSRRIGPAAGSTHLCFKLESVNPTGSYKDRFAAVAIADMLARGKRRVVATSSGNTGAALAAYAAAAGLPCEVAVVEGAPADKLRQMLACGAQLLRVRGFGPDPDVTRRTFEAVRRLGQSPGAALQVSAYCVSPAGMTGVQTIACELLEDARALGLPIARVFCPAGAGGLALAVARGFELLRASGRLAAMPRIEVVQPAGNDTIAGPFRGGANRAREVRCTTRISGLQVAVVLDGHDVIRECRATGGTGHLVEDEEVWHVQGLLAREEGILCEPAGAIATAAALKAASDEREGLVVCLVTGAGFKDPDALARIADPARCPTVDVLELERRAAAGAARQASQGA
jgi:threonine synthase